MTEERSHQQVVYKARTLEEVRQILRSAERRDIRSFLQRAYLSLRIGATNLLLRGLRLLLFPRWGRHRGEFRDIVVYTVGIVGDNVVLLPALAALRRRYPTGRITVITNCQIWDPQGAMEVLGPSPFKDRLIILSEDPVQRSGFQFVWDPAKFADLSCDLFVNLSPFGNRGWLGAVIREMIFARKLGARRAVGFRLHGYHGGGRYNKLQHHFSQNEPRRSRQVLRELNLEPVAGEDLFRRDPSARERMLEVTRRWEGDRRFLAVIHPGAKFSAQCWPTDRFGSVARWMAEEYGALVVASGTTSEREIAQEVVEACGGAAVNLAGQTTLQELVELLRLAKICVTNDTGTLHLAAMVGTPTVAIFTTRVAPTHWFPLHDRVTALFCLTDCSFCLNDPCERSDCLKGVGEAEVKEAIGQLLSSLSPEEGKKVHVGER